MSVRSLPSLKTGSVVRITWAGGNGPHIYIVEQVYSAFYARIPSEILRYGQDDPGRTYNRIADADDVKTLHQIEVLQP